jgi:hypothetical protein
MLIIDLSIIYDLTNVYSFDLNFWNTNFQRFWSNEISKYVNQNLQIKLWNKNQIWKSKIDWSMYIDLKI